jgi:arsenical pump membrane protein
MIHEWINGNTGRLCQSALQTVDSPFHFMDFVAREPLFPVCAITGATIAGLLFHPMRLPEAVWACLGALALILLRLISWDHTRLALSKGIDVYLFLTGMMLLAELARWEGVFDWLAAWAVRAANKSASRLFLLIYCVGTIVTVFLSNDATAVVLTPAVYAAVRKAKVDALPYLLGCAFIANAASFVLPISNPANIVVFDGQLPPLLPWMRTFLIPSVVSIAATFLVLRFASRKHLQEQAAEAEEPVALSGAGKLAAWGLIIATVILLAASISGISLGLPTCLAAVTAIILVALKDPQAPISVVREVSWSVIPLVAGLFVIVEALKDVGTLRIAQTGLEMVSRGPVFQGDLTGAFGVALISNLMNNLPVGLIGANALEQAHIAAPMKNAFLIGVDLGPNLSVTGSLATILWLINLRKEGYRLTAWTFLKFGILVMPLALVAAVLALVLCSSAR